MNTMTRLTIPMNKPTRIKLTKKADEFGFDSAQALLRYVIKAIIDGREVTFGQDTWGEPSARVLRRWQEELDDLPRQLKTGEAKSFNNPDEALKYLHSL